MEQMCLIDSSAAGQCSDIGQQRHLPASAATHTILRLLLREQVENGIQRGASWRLLVNATGKVPV